MTTDGDDVTWEPLVFMPQRAWFLDARTGDPLAEVFFGDVPAPLGAQPSLVTVDAAGRFYLEIPESSEIG